ncbi:MAG: 50S ribosomal protein L19 [Victivallales bacterium]|nr:50S ribosomal protein L19 [Victivallales bacterium]
MSNNEENKDNKQNLPAIEQIRRESLKQDLPEVNVGDTIQVSVKIIEGDKERVQMFEGVVIAKGGQGISETITLRRVTKGQGVERIFPVHSPKVAALKVTRRGLVRRAKLYYLRHQVGKDAKIKEKRDK